MLITGPRECRPLDYPLKVLLQKKLLTRGACVGLPALAIELKNIRFQSSVGMQILVQHAMI